MEFRIMGEASTICLAREASMNQVSPEQHCSEGETRLWCRMAECKSYCCPWQPHGVRQWTPTSFSTTRLTLAPMVSKSPPDWRSQVLVNGLADKMLTLVTCHEPFLLTIPWRDVLSTATSHSIANRLCSQQVHAECVEGKLLLHAQPPLCQTRMQVPNLVGQATSVPIVTCRVGSQGWQLNAICWTSIAGGTLTKFRCGAFAPKPLKHCAHEQLLRLQESKLLLTKTTCLYTRTKFLNGLLRIESSGSSIMQPAPLLQNVAPPNPSEILQFSAVWASKRLAFQQWCLILWPSKYNSFVYWTWNNYTNTHACIHTYTYRYIYIYML